MRLGTLARKISITPSKLTAFLESQEVDLPSGTNTKLTEQQVARVLEHFDAKIEAPVEMEVPAEPEPTETVVEDSPVLVDEQQVEPPQNLQSEEQPLEITVYAKDEPTAADPSKSQKEITLTEDESVTPKEPIRMVSDTFVEIALPHELEDLSDADSLSTTENVSDEEQKDAVQHDITQEETAQEETTQKETDTTGEPKMPKAAIEIDPEIESSVERAAYDDTIEVIKPPKVTLPGLKVKGKIDLPEPKVVSEETEAPKKEEKKPYDPDEIITTTGPKRERNRKPKNYKGKKYNKDYNPLEAARKKKEWEEKKRRDQEEKRKKKAKAKHYKKKVVTPPTIDTAKKKPKKTVAKKRQKQEQSSGNVLQRFWRWMNT